MEHLKFVDENAGTIQGIAAPFGGPFNGSDLESERFDRSTDFCFDWFPESRPVLYNHGLNGETQTAVVGRVKSWDVRDEGLWVQAQLDVSSKYFAAIKKLIDKDTMFFSSGSMSHLVKKSVNGTINRWPWIELSMTVSPVNPLATLDWDTTKSHFKSAGIDLDEDALKAKMDASARDALPDSEFAYVDTAGNRHLPVNDKEHAADALGRFNQQEFESPEKKAAAARKILAACEKFGIDVASDDAVRQAADAKKSADIASIKSLEGSYEDLIDDLQALLNPETPFGQQCYTCIVATYPDHVIAQRYEHEEECTFWSVAYTVGDDGDPVLGKATQVEQTYVPAKAYATESPITLDAQLLSRHAGALAERTKDLGERRIAEGRVLSTSNRTRIADTITALDGATSILQSTVDASDALHTAQVKATALMQPASLQRRLAALDLVIDTAPA